MAVDELEKILISDLNKYSHDKDVKQFLKVRFTILLQLYEKLNLVSFF